MFDCLIPEIASLICFITWYCFDFSSGDCVVSSDLCCWRCSGSRHCNWVCVGHLHSLRAAAEATSTTRSGRPSWAGFQLEKKKKLLPLSPLSPLSSRPSSSISSLSKSVANFGGKREFSSSSSSSRLLSSITLHMIDWLMIDSRRVCSFKRKVSKTFPLSEQFAFFQRISAGHSLGHSQHYFRLIFCSSTYTFRTGYH